MTSHLDYMSTHFSAYFICMHVANGGTFQVIKLQQQQQGKLKVYLPGRCHGNLRLSFIYRKENLMKVVNIYHSLYYSLIMFYSTLSNKTDTKHKLIMLSKIKICQYRYVN